MASEERPYYSKDDVVPQLWAAYKKTSDFAEGKVYAISSVHELVRKAESFGLNNILHRFLSELNGSAILLSEFESKSVGEWLTEWKEMHETLFHGVFTKRGCWRSEQVRFGAPGDEERHRIPQPADVDREMSALAVTISEKLAREMRDLNSKCAFLARTHYQFIRIHPFKDGNGRIGRVLIDQLAVTLGLTPAIAGYPRNNAEKKAVYHSAITACIDDPSCGQLKQWIQDQIERKSRELA